MKHAYFVAKTRRNANNPLKMARILLSFYFVSSDTPARHDPVEWNPVPVCIASGVAGIFVSIVSHAVFGLSAHPGDRVVGILATLLAALPAAAATSPLVFAAAWSAAAIPCTRWRMLMLAGFMIQIPLTHQAAGVLGKQFSPTLLALSIGFAGALPEILRLAQRRRQTPSAADPVDEPANASLLTPSASEADLLTSPPIAQEAMHAPIHEAAAACTDEGAVQEKTIITASSQGPDSATPEIAVELPLAELPLLEETAPKAQETAATEGSSAPVVTDAIEASAVELESTVIASKANEAGTEATAVEEDLERDLEREDDPAPAPRRAVCTVIHCELANHALLVNSMHPTEFTTLLNQVINAFEEMVGSRGGVSDRLSGDSLRAFFETPPTDPAMGQNALHCALALKNRFGAISQACELKSGIDLDLRIGVNTGEMVIARFGSGVRHFDGVAGESAEWGGRLASANLLYGSRILIGASSHLLAGDGFEARPIDLLQREMPPEPPEAVFELLATKGALSMDARERLNLYCEGVMLFRERRWKEAAAALRAAQPKRSNDDAIDLLLHRISEQETLAEFTV
jgi:class 3 adenylate cyclase